MQTTFLKVLGATLIAATTIQVAGATEHHARKARAPATEHHARKARESAIEQFRNSNAYAAPGDIAAQSSYLSNLAEGAIASGVAGR